MEFIVIFGYVCIVCVNLRMKVMRNITTPKQELHYSNLTKSQKDEKLLLFLSISCRICSETFLYISPIKWQFVSLSSHFILGYNCETILGLLQILKFQGSAPTSMPCTWHPWLGFAITNLMPLHIRDNDGQAKDGTFKECWLKPTHRNPSFDYGIDNMLLPG